MTSNPSGGVNLLLDLPQELRFLIYGVLLVHHGNLYFHPAYSFYHRTHKLYPRVLRTCRFIYAEAVPVLYSKNNFVIDSVCSMLRLQKMVKGPSLLSSEENIRRITSLSIHGWSRLQKFLDDIETTATELLNLHSLSIELDDIIMGQYIPHISGSGEVSKYVDRKGLRKSLLSSFRTITNGHPLLKRIIEVRYKQDTHYSHGMHFRLLGNCVKNDKKVIDTIVHSSSDWSTDLQELEVGD